MARGAVVVVVAGLALCELLAACAPPPPSSAAPTTGVVDDGSVAVPQQPPVLIASPAPGAFAAPPVITLTVDDPSAAASDGLLALTVWLTLDGSLPTPGAAQQYSAPIALTGSTEVRALAVDALGVVRASLVGTYLVLDEDAASFSSNLPVLVFWSQAPVPGGKDERYTDFTLSTFDPARGGARVQWPCDAQQSMRAGLKVRGSSSAGYAKRPWRVETRGVLDDEDAPISLAGLSADGDWVLNAPADFDRALMRNTLAFSMSNAIGRWAPHTAHAEVFVAGSGSLVGMDDYVGVYEVTEHIERGDERVDIRKLRPEEIALPDVSGGYIIKEDRTGPGEGGFFAGTGDGALSFQQPFVWVEPKESEVIDAQAQYLRDYLDDVGRALTAPDFTSSLSGAHYGALIDVDAFIDHHIVNVLTKNPDAFRLSGYYHKDRDGPLVAGPVWDFDRTMGCASDGRCDDPTWWDASNVTGDTTRVFDHGFYRGLFADPVFRTAYFARMGEVLADDGPLALDRLLRFIDDTAAQLDEAAARNFARWGEFAPRGSYPDEVALLKQWLTIRHQWMRDCLALPDPRTCQGQ